MRIYYDIYMNRLVSTPSSALTSRKSKYLNRNRCILNTFRLIRPIWPKFDLWWPLIGHDIQVMYTGHVYGFEVSKRIPIFWGICHQNWSTRWRYRVFFRFLFILLQSHVIAALSLPKWCRTHKADVIDDVTKQMLLIAFFCCFLGFRLRKWPPTTKGQVWKWSQENEESFGLKIKNKCWFSTKKYSKSAIWIRGNS